MEYFWDTIETIPDGQGWPLFGATHLATLAVLALAGWLLCRAYRAGDARRRGRIRALVAAALVADELFKHAGLLYGGNWLLSYLPLHLCSINIFVVVLYVLRPSNALANFLYAVCLPGALAALLTPTWQTLPAWNFMYLHSTSIHLLLAVFPLMLLSTGEMRREARTIPKTLALLAALAVPIYWFDRAFDVNFMFLNWAPEGTPLVWFGEHWGSHLLGYPAIIAPLLALLYVPLRRKRANAVERRQ